MIQSTRSMALWLFAVLVMAVLLRTFVVGAYQVSSNSMEPAVHAGDFVVGLKRSVLTTDFKRGDVIAVTDDGGTVWVRRVIGLPGDKVEFNELGLVLNDRLITEDGFESTGSKRWKIRNLPSNIRPAYRAPVIVPLGKYFILADQRFSEGPLGLIGHQELVGRLSLIWLSVGEGSQLRWARIGQWIQ